MLVLFLRLAEPGCYGGAADMGLGFVMDNRVSRESVHGRCAMRVLVGIEIGLDGGWKFHHCLLVEVGPVNLSMDNRPDNWDKS